MLKSADIVIITKGDIVSQAEREVFASRVNSVNPTAVTMHVNGLTGQGAYELSTLLYEKEKEIDTVQGKQLRFPMPSALCSLDLYFVRHYLLKCLKYLMLQILSLIHI